MSSLFNRLAQVKAKLLGGEVRDDPVPFEVVCNCGHRVAGIRRPACQILVCSECGSNLFALPRDAYPAVRRSGSGRAPAEKSTSKATSQTQSPPSSDVASVASGTEQAKREVRADSRRSADGKPDGSLKSRTDQPLPLEADVIPLPPKVPAAVRIRRIATPVRILTVAGLALVSVTVWWMIRQRTLEEARRTWRREMDVVEKALADRDRSAVQEALTKAVAAADILNRDDEDARDARSLLLQARSIERWKSSSADIVGTLSALTPAKSENLTEIQRTMSLLEKVFSIFETELQPVADDADRLTMNVPLLIPTGRVRIEVRSRRLRSLAEKFPGEPVLFVACVRRASRTETGGWLIELEADSIALLTSDLYASEAGYDTKQIPEVTAILERQQEYILSDAAWQKEAVQQEPAR